MSDALILGLLIPTIAAISTGVNIWLNGRVAAKLAAQLAETKASIVVVKEQLEENHKQQNGNLTKLLETTSQLATAKEKAKNKEENKK